MSRYRYLTAWHEAGHAVMAYLVGRQITHIEPTPKSEITSEGDVAGRCRLASTTLADLNDAADAVLIYLAG